jgi:hypothetical protein
MSDEITVSEALAKAQEVFKPVPKDKKHPHYNSEYSSLDAILDATREGLTTNGLALLHRIVPGDPMAIEAILFRGKESLSSGPLTVIVDKQNMQGLGSALTYARRYTAAALLGVCSDEDDDGNAASAGAPKRNAKAPVANGAAPKDKTEPKSIAEVIASKKTVKPLNDWLLGMLANSPPSADNLEKWDETCVAAKRHIAASDWSEPHQEAAYAVLQTIQEQIVKAEMDADLARAQSGS